MRLNVSHTAQYYQVAEQANIQAFVIDQNGDEVIDENGAYVVADTGASLRRYSVSHSAQYYQVAENELSKNMVSDPGFDDPTAWTKFGNFNVTGSKGVCNAISAYLQQPIVTTPDSYYLFEVEVTDYTSGALYVTIGNTSYDLGITGTGTYRVIRKAGSLSVFRLITFTGFVGSVDNASLREIS